MADFNSPQHSKPHQEQGTGVISHGVLNVLLVFLESAITLMLRFNPKLRQLAYPLAQDEVLVSIRTYLPHVQIYATFNHHGVLLDSELPAHKEVADIAVNAYSFQLANTLTNHSTQTVDKLQMRGDAAQVAQFKEFLVQLGIGGVIDHLLRKTKKADKPTAEQKAEKLGELKTKIAEQSQKISDLTTQNARLTAQLGEAKTKQKSTFTGFIIASLIAIAALVSHFFV
ncbi:MAG: hypothetical protein Q4B81_02450 [Moraxella sp.]|nr:hypothetical protein [Moraxella sp.]